MQLGNIVTDFQGCFDCDTEFKFEAFSGINACFASDKVNLTLKLFSTEYHSSLKDSLKIRMKK